MESDRWIEAKFALQLGLGIMLSSDDRPGLTLGMSKELGEQVKLLNLVIDDRVVIKYDSERLVLKEIRRLMSYELTFVEILPAKEGEPQVVEFTEKDGNLEKDWLLTASEGILGRIKKFKEKQRVGVDIMVKSLPASIGEIFNLRDQ